MQDRKRCKTCYYWGWLSTGHCCDYATVTGKTRLSQMTKEERKKPCRFYREGNRARAIKRLILGGEE